MRTLTSLKEDTLEKEKLTSKFGIDFIIKNNQVYLVKKNDSLKYYFLLENDSEYFFKSLLGCKKTKYSSKSWSFIPVKGDWEYIKKKNTIIVLPITKMCNSDCKICFMKDRLPYDEMSIDDIKDVLAKIGKNKKILLFGGEPTLRDDIFKIIRLIKKSRNIPTICTNGLKLADRSFVKKLKESGIKRILLSFDGFREEIYENLRGNSGHLYLKLRALKNLKDFKIKVYLSSTIAYGVNENEISNLLKFAIRNNDFIIGINIYPATPYGKFDISIKKYLTPSDIVSMLEKASSGLITKEYVLEFKRLRMNLNRVLSKFKIFFPCYSYYHSHTLLKVENNQLKHFISLNDLKGVNEFIQNRKYLNLLVYFIKNPRLVKNSLSFVLRKFNSESLGKNVFIVQLGNVITPLNYLPVEYDCIEIEKLSNNSRDENYSHLNGELRLEPFRTLTTGPG
jgi:uncharacterized radical SAM superfamily Fe-S cluster-containing enzyme